jgi:hypothetical protein
MIIWADDDGNFGTECETDEEAESLTKHLRFIDALTELLMAVTR